MTGKTVNMAQKQRTLEMKREKNYFVENISVKLN